MALTEKEMSPGPKAGSPTGLTEKEMSPGPKAGDNTVIAKNTTSLPRAGDGARLLDKEKSPGPRAGGDNAAVRATKIMELKSGIAWRGKWMPAKFRGARFHVESAARESARRIVSHEFPKRDVPYAEDMGRRAREFTVRGYIIAYPRDVDGDGNEMKKKNYITARDTLIKALEEDGPAILQLPLLGFLNVACTRYRVTEENRTGGYVVFDMSFTEFGQAPATGNRRSSPAGVYYNVRELNQATIDRIFKGLQAAQAQAQAEAQGPPA